MDALQFCDVIGVGNAHWAEILGAESSQALFSQRNAEFLNTVDVRDFGENLFLFRIECEDGEVFGVENAENFFAQIKENMVKIAGRMDLLSDALDILGECHFLLKFLQILWDGIGVHYTNSWPSITKAIARSVYSMKRACDSGDFTCLLGQRLKLSLADHGWKARKRQFQAKYGNGRDNRKEAAGWR